MADRYVATSATPGTDVDGLGGGSVAAGDISDAGTVGVDLVQSETAADAVAALGGAASLRALLLGPFFELMTGTGWPTSTPSGGATATWADDKLTLDCDPGSAGSCGASKATALPSGRNYRVAIRLQVISGDNSSQTRIILACGQSATDYVQMMFFTDGSIEIGATVGGSYTYWYVANTIAAINNALRTGGKFWICCDRSPGLLTWSWGEGVGGALPSVWNEIYSSTERHVAGQDAQARAAKKASNGRFVAIYGVTLSGVDLVVAVHDIVTGLPGADFGGA